MKIFVGMIAVCALFTACSKKEVSKTDIATDSVAIIDSINKVRLAHNAEIRNKNHFPSVAGTHILTHNMIGAQGKISFSKVEGTHDEYRVKGEVKQGKDFFNISGTAERVSEKHMNFFGKISQSIYENDHGAIDSRDVNTSLITKNKGKTWKFQGLVNAAGFVDDVFVKMP